MADRSKTVLTLIIGAVVGIGPAYFGYLSSHEELKAKYQQTQDEATGGYAALAASVKELQASVMQQHDYIIKLETHLDDMDKYIVETRAHVGTVGVRPPVAPTTTLKPPAPPERPKFGDLPRDFPDAAMKFAPKR
jgi:hypothetical protein